MDIQLRFPTFIIVPTPCQRSPQRRFSGHNKIKVLSKKLIKPHARILLKQHHRLCRDRQRRRRRRTILLNRRPTITCTTTTAAASPLPATNYRINFHRWVTPKQQSLPPQQQPAVVDKHHPVSNKGNRRASDEDEELLKNIIFHLFCSLPILPA